MDQFRDFEKFINRVNYYGMKTGIVKVIPPAEWYPPQETSTNVVGPRHCRH